MRARPPRGADEGYVYIVNAENGSSLAFDDANASKASEDEGAAALEPEPNPSKSASSVCRLAEDSVAVGRSSLSESEDSDSEDSDEEASEEED